MTNARGIISAAALLALLGTTGCNTAWIEVGASALATANYIDEMDEPPAPDYTADVGEFAELDAWGAWHFVEPMGWVWSPHVGSYWRPFTNGHWYWSDHGWTWWSYDPWGWATAHYGFWEHDRSLGWVWIPDWEWSAARVDWIIYEDQVCWAPLPWDTYWPDPWEGGGGSYWVVVDYEHFDAAGVGNYHRSSKFKGRHSPRRGHAPDVGVIERRNRRTMETITLEFKGTRRGENDNTVQRIVGLPNPVTVDDDIVIEVPGRRGPRAHGQPPGTDNHEPRTREVKTEPRREPETREVKTRTSKTKESTRPAKSRSGSGDSKKRKSR